MKFATLGYLRKDGKTLMLHRVKKENDMHEGKWNGLGGKIEDGETPFEGIIREVKEESGLNVSNPKMKAIITFPAFSKGETWHVFVFLIDDFDGEINPDCNEGNLSWVPDSELFGLNLWEGDKIFMKCLDEKGIFTGKFCYENGELVSHQFNQLNE